LIAWRSLRPEKLVPKVASPEEKGFARVLLNKYYVDEIYDRVIVNPVIGISRVILWKVVDVGIIDGLVNLSALMSRGFGYLGARLQSGQVGTYAWVIIIGVIAVLGTVAFR
jgi:NADH-quinone oxidoreductase subunit L